MPRRPRDATVQIGLRLKESLRRLLENEAKKAGRSLNQEMALRLERSFDLEIELEQARLKLAERDLTKTLLALAKDTLERAKEVRDETTHRAEQLRSLRQSEQRLKGLLSPTPDKEKK